MTNFESCGILKFCGIKFCSMSKSTTGKSCKTKRDEDEEGDLYILSRNKQCRREKYQYNRLDMDEHFEMCRHTEGFQLRYHMSENAFRNLVMTLGIHVDEKRSRASTGDNHPISSEMVVAIGLRFMGGEKMKSLADTFGTSLSSIKRAVGKFLDAVNRSDDKMLGVDLPVSYEERTKVAQEWGARSEAFGLFYGCVGAIDGWLCTLEKPEDVPNPGDYFSGHYQKFGINVQAVCDANLKFTYVAVAATGGTNDERAFRKLHKLKEWIASLPNGFFLVGDNAYSLTNKLLIPFSGAEKHDHWNDAYNFFLSQLRIRIEMAFGRLTTKWRIFRHDLPSEHGIERCCDIVRAGMKLHNYVITYDRLNFCAIPDDDLVALEVEPLADGPVGNVGYLPTAFEELHAVDPDAEESDRRNSIVQGIMEKPLQRPDRNNNRNK